MKPPSAIACWIGCRSSSTMTATKSSVVIRARFAALCQLGGRLKRLLRPARAASLRCCLRSSGLGGRLVGARVSPTPAAVSRCLVRRLRLVWAIVRSRVVQAARTKRPSSRTCVPSMDSDASVTTQSRWMGTDTVPPMAMLAPNATWTVPRIFSSSRTLPVRVARSFVPTPSSARFVPFSPCSRRMPSSCSPSRSVASVRWPFVSVSFAGWPVARPIAAIERAYIVPVPFAGAMNPSPHGRLPNAPGAVRSPSSAMPWRPLRSRLRSVPRGHAIFASVPLSSSSAIACERLFRRSKSIAISRASMSVVTCGIVAPRAPASLARLRASVWLSERDAGAMNTSHAASASATGAGGSEAAVGRGDITARTASAPLCWAASRSFSPSSCSGSSTTTTTSSSGRMLRQRRTTVCTARSRSVMGWGVSRFGRPRRRAGRPRPARVGWSMSRLAIWSLYALLVAIWSSTWVAIKIGLEDTPPLLGAGVRFAIAGVGLLALAAVRGRSLRTDRLLATVLAVLPFFGTYALVYWGEQYVPSGLAAVLFGVLPIYVALIASVFLRDEPLRARLLCGVVLALGGLAAAFSESVALGDSRYAVIAALGCALAPLGAAIGNVTTKRRGAGVDALVLNGWAAVGGGVLLLLVSAVSEDWGGASWTAGAVGSILYLAAIGTALAFVTLTRLLAELPAVTMSFIALLLPFGALAFGALVYGEPLTVAELGGAALVACGIAVAQLPLAALLARRRAAVTSRAPG